MVNFFQKLGLGLKKTSAKLTGGISDIFTKQKVDSQTLNDLQDVLIAADMGVKASAKIIETFGKRRLNKDISEAEIRSELAADIEQILTPCEKGFVIDNHKKPCIILMIGVNGAGKTTTIGKLAAKLKNAQSGHKPQISFNIKLPGLIITLFEPAKKFLFFLCFHYRKLRRIRVPIFSVECCPGYCRSVPGY